MSFKKLSTYFFKTLFLNLFFLSQLSSATYYSRNSGLQDDNIAGCTQLWATTPIGVGTVQYPLDSTSDYVIQSGNIVQLQNTIGTSAAIRGLTVRHLMVQSGGKLYSNISTASATHYICIKGNIVCNGTIGNGATFDAISFNIADGTHTISGTGTFDCSRITKSDVNTLAGASLTFSMDANIEYSSGAGIYNKQNASNLFNVTIGGDKTVNVSGDVAMDGSDGAASGESGGTFYVYGTLNIAGTLWLRTNNTSNACRMNIGVIGLGLPGIVVCSKIYAGASGAAQHTLNVYDTGLLKITGLNTYTVGPPALVIPPISPFSTVNNTYNIISGEVEYAGLGDQSIEDGLLYNRLTLSGAGTKDFDTDLVVTDDLLVDGVVFRHSTTSQFYSLFIGGDFTLTNGATMHNDCRSSLNIELNNLTSFQYIDGGGQDIKCLRFNSTKTLGCISLNSGTTNLDIKSDFFLDISGVMTSFSDGGNTITVGDDIGLGGNASSYNFTGTLKFTFESSSVAGVGSAYLSDYTSTSECVAQLNNVIVDASSSAGVVTTLEVYPTLGNRTITIMGNLQILNTSFSSRLDGNGNTIQIQGNWSTYNNTAYIENTSTVAFNGSSAQTLVSGNYEDFWNLKIDNSNGLTLNAPANVSNQLDLTLGKIYSTSTNLLTMTYGSTVANVSNNSFVSGPVKKIGNSAFIFPVGKNSYYRLIRIGAPFDATDGFTAEYFESDPGLTYNANSKDPTLNHISQCEYWILNRTTGSSNVNVTLSWDANSCGVTSLPDLRVARWDAATLMWKDHGNGLTTGNTTIGTVTTAGVVSTFSPFTLSSSSNQNPLPIELLSFTATAMENQINISWITASENNTDYFEVEKSIDGINFELLTKMQAAGSSVNKLEYNAVDVHPFEGVNYYRLKQIDVNKSFTYSDIISVNYEMSSSNDMFYSYPNPFNDHLTITYSFYSNDLINVQLMDVLGKIVYYNQIEKGRLKTLVIETGDLEKGVYFLSLRSSEQHHIYKLLK